MSQIEREQENLNLKPIKRTTTTTTRKHLTITYNINCTYDISTIEEERKETNETKKKIDLIDFYLIKFPLFLVIFVHHSSSYNAI